MFCGYCGKELIGNTKFCQFCGAEQTAVVIPAAGIPVSAPIGEPDDTASVSDVSSVSVSSTPVTPDIESTPIEPIEPVTASMGVLTEESASIGDDSASAENIAAAPTEVVAHTTSDLPTPNTIPTSNLDMPETAVRSIPVQTAPARSAANIVPQTVVTIKDEEKRPPERKYSLKHIVMCLAAAAVMAVAAGVFAGLYFSAIL